MNLSLRGNYGFQIDLIKEGLHRSKKILLTVSGKSMEPTIKSGESLEVSRFFHPVRLGEIYLYENQEGRLCVHRLIRKIKSESNLKCVFKGDALTLADQPIESSNVLGKVIRVGKKRSSISFPGFMRFHSFFHRLRPWLNLFLRKYIL